MVDYNKYKSIDYDKDGVIEPTEVAAATRVGGPDRTTAEAYKNATGDYKFSNGSAVEKTSTSSSNNKNNNKNDKNKDKNKNTGGGASGVSIAGNEFTMTDSEGVPQSGAYISWNSGEQPVAWQLSKAIKQIQQRYGVDAIWKAVEKVAPSIVGTGYGGSNYISALTQLVQNYSVANYYATASSPEGSTSGAMTFLEFLNGLSSGGSGGGSASPTRFVSLTGKNTAWDVYKSTFRNLMGMNPTKDQFDDFYAKLNAKEKKYVSTRNQSGSTQTEVSEQFDIQTFAVQHALNQADLTGDLKGVTGQYQNWITQTSKAYGLEGSIPQEKYINYIKGLATGKFQEDDLTDMLRRKAAITYGAFAEDLEKNPDLSLAEIMESYMSMYSNTLEIGYNEVNIADVARLASSGTEKVNMYDFEKALRQDGRYQTTKQANMEAQNLAVSFARAFGMNI